MKIRPIYPDGMTTLQPVAIELADLSLQKKLQNNHLQAHHFSEAMYLNRCHVANTMGLSESQKRQISPFPPSTSTTIINNDGALVMLEKVLDRLVGNQAKPVEEVKQTPETAKTPPIQINPIPVKPNIIAPPKVITDSVTPTEIAKEEPWYKKYAAWLISAAAILGPTVGTIFGWWMSEPTSTDPKPPVVEQPADTPVEGKMRVKVY